MSYARLGAVKDERATPSDVYVFGSVNGFLECCGCRLALAGSYRMKSMAEANEHFAQHEIAGHSCGEPWTDMLAAIQKDAGSIWGDEPFDFEVENAQRHLFGLGLQDDHVTVRVDLPGGRMAEFDARIMGRYGSLSAGGLIVDVDTRGKPRIFDPPLLG